MRKRLEAWCKKHADLLIFSGALIVFVTFVVKEGLEEHWRRVAEDINKAQSLYTVRERLDRLMENTNSIRDELYNVHEQAKQTTGTYNSEKARYNTFTAEVLEIMNESELDSIVAQVLPSENQTRREIVDIDTKVKTFLQQDDEIYTAIMGPGSDVLPDNYNPHTWKKDAVKKAEELQSKYDGDVDRVRATLPGITAKLLSDAEQLRKHNERLAELARWISAFLFSLGWGLGLVGKLYGVPDAAGGG